MFKSLCVILFLHELVTFIPALQVVDRYQIFIMWDILFLLYGITFMFISFNCTIKFYCYFNFVPLPLHFHLYSMTNNFVPLSSGMFPPWASLLNSFSERPLESALHRLCKSIWFSCKKKNYRKSWQKGDFQYI